MEQAYTPRQKIFRALDRARKFVGEGRGADYEAACVIVASHPTVQIELFDDGSWIVTS